MAWTVALVSNAGKQFGPAAAGWFALPLKVSGRLRFGALTSDFGKVSELLAPAHTLAPACQACRKTFGVQGVTAVGQEQQNGLVATESRQLQAVRARRTGLCLPARLSFAAWRRIGEHLLLVSDSSGWWLGDWLVYGEGRFGDRYKQAIAKTSLDYQTLRNYAWVARRFDVSRRRDTLSFQHHVEVAALPPEQQRMWLDRAETFGWSRNRLRRELRASRTLRDSATPADTATKPVVILQIGVDQEQQQRWQQAAVRVNRRLEDWVAQVIDDAANLLLEPQPPATEAGNAGSDPAR